MFSFQFFSSLSSQRRSLLASTEQAPVPFSPELAAALEALESPGAGEFVTPKSRFGVLALGFLKIRAILLRCVLWRAVSAFVVLGGVLASSNLIAPERELAGAIFLALAFLFSRLADGTIEYFDALRRAQINRIVQTELMRLVNRKLLDVDPDGLKAFSKGELKTLVSSDVEAVEDFVTAAVQQVVPAVVIFLTLGPAIYFVSGTVGLVGLVTAILVLPFSITAAKGIEFFQLRAQTVQDRLTSCVGEWVRNIRLIRFLGWNEALLARAEGLMRRFTYLVGARHTLACIIYGITTSWWMIPILSMIAFSKFRGLDLTVVQLFAAVWMLEQLVQYLTHLNYVLSLYGTAVAGAERLKRLWDTPTLSSKLVDRTAEPLQDGSKLSKITLRDVSIVSNGSAIIDRISLELDVAKRTAIVGEVGAGKSVLLEVLVGERPVSSGELNVTFSGPSSSTTEAPVPGRELPLWSVAGYEAARRAIAYAPQQPYLSNALVRSNIDLGASGKLSEAEVLEAARKAQLEIDIASFRRGLDEEVGETGINLSGGQKQRVSLARAFLSRRPVMVLDDPLSAVDRDTATALVREIFSLGGGLIIVSHRLEELMACDRVIVLSHGKVAEDGAPRELAATSTSRFSQLLAAGELE
jgi:ATP-binding cassette subfamily B tetracycline resistance protein